jgi:heme exporter protein D
MISHLMMGGYASYVWSAYGLVFAVLTLNLITINWQRKRLRKLLQQWFKSL